MVEATDMLAALARLRAASRALAAASGADAVLETLMQRALDAGDATGAVVVTAGVDDKLEVVATTYGDVSRTILDGCELGESRPLNDAIRTGQPVWLEDRTAMMQRYPALEERAISAGWVALPLRVGNRVIGALSISFSVAQRFDEPQRLYLLTLADMSAIVLDRDVLSERQAEDQLRALVGSNVVGVIGGDIDSILEANDAFLGMIGRTRAELVTGIDFRAITAPEDVETDARAVANADPSGRFGPYEKEYVHVDGHRVPARVVGAIISLDGRGRWIALVEDLSAARAVEGELRAREARYRSLVEAANTIVWTADPLGRFIDGNDAWSAYTGQSPEHARDHGWLDAFRPEDRERVFDALERARVRRQPWEGRARLHHAASGADRRSVVRAVPMLDDDGNIVEWVGTVADVDDQARTEEVLRSTTARLAALMRNAPVGFAFIDHDLRFQVVNEKLAEFSGIPAHEHLGRDVREVVPFLAGEDPSLFARVLSGESIVDVEVLSSTQDWLVNYYPVRDQHSAILGIGATVVDVTERNLLLAEAVESAELAEALSIITADVANAVDDDVIAQAAGRGLQRTLDADAVLIARSDGRGRIQDVLFAHGYTPDDLVLISSAPEPDAWSTSVVVPHRAPIFYESPEEFLARFPSREPQVAELGARAWTVVPLVAAEHVIGFFVVMFRQPHRFSPDERRFAATVGDVVAQAIVRARAHSAEALARHSAETLAEAIAAERARLAAVLHHMPAGLIVVDAVGNRPRVVLSNTRAADILGPPPANGDAEEWLTLRSVDGQPLAPEKSVLRRALDGLELSEPEEATVWRQDGSNRRIRATAVPIRDGEMRVTSSVLVIEDVSAQARRERDAHLLARVSDVIGSSSDLTDVLQRMVALPVPTFADVCGIYVLVDDELHLSAVADLDVSRAGQVREFLTEPIPLDGDTPLARAVRSGEPILVAGVSAQSDRAKWVEEVVRPRSMLVVPLRRRENNEGALVFSQTAETGRVFNDDDIGLAVDLAARCSLLLEQVVAHEETARARDRADRLQGFAAAMARAVSVDAVVAAILAKAQNAVGAHFINVAMQPTTDANLEPVQTGALSESAPIEWLPIDPRSDGAAVEALRQGRAVFYPDATAYTERFAVDAGALAQSRVEAVTGLPMFGSDGHIIGSLGFAFPQPQPFDDEQRSFLETVADVAGQSLDRARLYERERDVARALQMALLPSALPELDDVVTEARYVAGGMGVSVGGDWYDVLRFADGRVGLLIGDAAGRGVEAATLMGKVRHAAAALAMDRASPAAVLARVNEYLYTISTRRAMLTCCYVVLDRDSGLLRYSSAGHPPPVIIDREGVPQLLTGGRGVPLGVLPAATYSDAEFQLADAATIVLYTDGLIERRGETIDVGLQRMLDEMRGRGDDVKALCDHLTTTLLAAGSDDDVALLAARVQAVATASRLDLELPADSRRLHELRTRVTKWLHDAGVEATAIPDVVIALNEAVSNSMLHAYSGTLSRGHVRVTITLDGNEVSAIVSDNGHWRAPLDGHDGRGIDLMESLMHDVRVERAPDGTRVHLARTLHR